MKLPVIYKKNSFITVVIGKKPITLISSDINFDSAVNAYKAQNWAELELIIDRPKLIERYSDGDIKVFDGEVTFKGTPVHNYVATKIQEFLNDEFDITVLVKFLNSLMNNPNPNVQSSLFQFLESNNLPLTEDGGFLAYKLTTNDCKPIYHDDGATVYAVGKTMEMDKDKVFGNKDRSDCGGEGYYFGNKTYWNGCFDEENRYTGDGRMFIVKLMPEWVGNIPDSDAGKKGRAYKMIVLDEYESVRQVIHDNKIVEVSSLDSVNIDNGGVIESQDYLFDDGDSAEVPQVDIVEDKVFQESIKQDIEVNKILSTAEFVEKLKDKVIGNVYDDVLKLRPIFYKINPSIKQKRDKNGRFIKKSVPKRDKNGKFVSSKSNKR